MITTIHQQKSFGHLLEARNHLESARYELGNDHPAYDRLVAMIREAHEIERLY